MSGFVALFQRNGAPVDRALLAGLTSFLSFRGPDALETWSSGPIGLGHTLLRTSRSTANERQPVSFDGSFWIVADVRLDRRSELRDQLTGAGQDVDRNASDSELILHAYMTWSDDCVKRLFGDFSFAIWNGRERRIFCARDHFGIKPFYYTETRDFFLCSNTLDCIRQHPGVSDELNDQAVADFLLFGINCDKATTIFQSIQRLPPAHFLSASSNNVRTQRYWSAPVDGWIRYRREEEYAEHFRENVRVAVAERMDVDTAGILLSGGMDSGTIAAVAKELSRASGTRLKGYTVTYEKLLGDREGYFAQQTADFLNLLLEIIPMDDLDRFTPGQSQDVRFPEPIDEPFAAAISEYFRIYAKYSRAFLSGEGADNHMDFRFAPYVKALVRRREWLTLAGAALGFSWKQRTRAHRLWHRAMRRLKPTKNGVRAPRWISPDFARRINFEERFRHFALPKATPPHPVLPIAHASIELPQWPRLFEVTDAGFTQELVEIRYPFLDLRIVEYLLALPPFPLFFHKQLERAAMKGRLPEIVLTRPKTPLGTRPCIVHLVKAGHQSFQNVVWSDDIDRYVSRLRVHEARDIPYSDYGNSCIRPICFNLWLQSFKRVRYKLCVGMRNG
ncbi:MAG TPA: asparagine synthase-related protein [Candidatus Acidoferrales bacterium]|nr:asparagine synthase-related protein [Candidatus Acidoferrales bacterium]